jgi:hypothetical protein
MLLRSRSRRSCLTFASMANTRPIGERWTDSISHGELIRSGYDERLCVDPANLRFLFQGVSNRERAGKPYGQIPWRLGTLKPADDEWQPDHQIDHGEQ